MSDPRHRPGLVPERLLLPPPPREPALRARWDALDLERRRALARALATGTDGLPEDDAALVRELARVRVATGWRLQVAALLLGWLMLMTLWGFGRSTYPAHVDAYLAAGLAAGAVVWGAAARAGRRRIVRAREIARR